MPSGLVPMGFKRGGQCKSLSSSVKCSKLKDLVTTRAAALCASWSLWMDFIGKPAHTHTIAIINA